MSLRPRALLRLVVACASASIAIAASERPARAQACCGAANAVTPGRLAMYEDELVGVQLRGAYVTGSFDADRTYARSPASTSEWDFEQDLLATARVLHKGQIGLVVPYLETRRATPTARATGHGLGDVRLAARWDFTLAGHSQTLPGVALLASITAPTGTPPERASDPLATDATGIGAWQGAIGVAIEQTFGGWFVGLYETIARRLPRTIDGVRSTLGTESVTTVAAGYTFTSDLGVAWIATYDLEGEATVDDASSPGSGKALLTTGLVANYPITDSLRVLGALAFPLPISGLGKNHPAADALSITVLYGWM